MEAEIEELIEGKTVEKPVHEANTYDEIYDSMDNLWKFIFFTGYFRKVSERMDSDDNRYIEFTIPNREGGTGRSDLFVKPVTRRKPAYVLEFKVAEKFIAG